MTIQQDPYEPDRWWFAALLYAGTAVLIAASFGLSGRHSLLLALGSCRRKRRLRIRLPLGVACVQQALQKRFAAGKLSSASAPAQQDSRRRDTAVSPRASAEGFYIADISQRIGQPLPNWVLSTDSSCSARSGSALVNSSALVRASLSISQWGQSVGARPQGKR